MALVIADRVKVTTTTTGTGTLTLGSAVTGFQDFGVVGDGNTTYYTISVPGGADWEVGIGTYTASGTTLSRDTILASSNAGSAVNLSAGTKDVFITYPSDRSVVSLDGNNSEFSSATRMIFAQATAPTGWTKDTINYDNHALRVVTGAASTGGTVDFTSAFVAQTPTGNVSTTVTASTGQIAQGGNISVSTGQAAAPGSIGQTAAPIGQTAAPIGQAAGPVSIGNAASPNGNTTLAVPTIPSHSHTLVNAYPPTPSPTRPSAPTIIPSIYRQINLQATNATGGGGAHTHPAGNHVHPASGGQHVHPSPAHGHPSPAHGHPFTGGQHAHPASGNFTGSQHAHPVSAPASSSFTGNAIDLAVKYLDVITATKD